MCVRFFNLILSYCSACYFLLMIAWLSFHINTFINPTHTFHSIPLYELLISKYLAYVCAFVLKNSVSLSILVLRYLYTGAHISKNLGKITTSAKSKNIPVRIYFKNKEQNKQNFKIPLQVTFNRGNLVWGTSFKEVERILKGQIGHSKISNNIKPQEAGETKRW